MDKPKHIYVGLSGGVDSSVAALLLLEQGITVTGIFMKNWSDCDWITEERWAKKVAAHLDIPCETWDFEKEYKELVVTNFFDEYKKGRTPNPDVLCNKYIKFDLFLKKARQRGADGIATGHYAQTEKGRLFRGRDTDKDQSYFLYALTKEQLNDVTFPLGELRKSRVREIAKNAHLPNFDKKDSQGICFVGAVDVKTFLEKELPKKTGDIVNEEGNVIGAHDGVQFFTEGQREGLNLGGMVSPHYVAIKDIKSNKIIATPKESPLHYSYKAIVKNLYSIHTPIEGSMHGKVRYRQKDQRVEIKKIIQGHELVFDSPQFALSEGQSVVFYKNEECLGGGVIHKVVRPEGLVEKTKMKLNVID
jgi:tRNA-uridine 2-sulfurtransferase